MAKRDVENTYVGLSHRGGLVEQTQLKHAKGSMGIHFIFLALKE